MKARAVGVHLYIATQRPGPEVLLDVLVGGIFGRLVFAVASKTDSEWLLGETGAEQITEQGRLIFQDRTSDIKLSVKAVYITDDEIERVVVETKERTEYS